MFNVFKKPVIDSNNTTAIEVLGVFCKIRGKKSAKTGKKWLTNGMKNPGRAFENGVNF